MRKRKVVLAVLIPVFVMLVVFVVRIVDDAQNQAGFEAKRAEIDSIIGAVCRAPKDVLEDLDRRALYVVRRDRTGDMTGDTIRFGKIGELIEDGLYHIGEEGALQFGPAPAGAN